MTSGSHTHHSIDYFELAVSDLAAARRFYEQAFEWSFTEYGPEYVGFVDGPPGSGRREIGGLCVEPAAATRGSTAPLFLLYSRDLEASRERVRAAGGALTRDIFAFPGGRRFQFTDPAGNELGVWSDG
jgi:predicted enzyme related to lactoylglutathione lyase